MRILYIPLSVFLASCVCARPQHKVYSNSWAVRVHGGADVASQLASRHGYTYLGKVFDDLYHFQHQKVHKRSLRIYKRHHHVNLLQEPAVYAVQQQVVKIRTKRTALLEPTDPLYDSQWYLGPDQKSHVESHLNVPSAWDQGYTGRGVVVSILDDGIEKAHPDLAPNYDPDASYDLNGNDPDPEARETKNDNNRHGTRCAGEVAAVANNSVCGVGVAYNAKIGGVRMLDGDVTDVIEAGSLSLNPQHIHIYSASWGPEDDGLTVDGPGPLALEAFQRGITEGRSGLGSIFVWASGNGGTRKDNCNCDGYTNSIYTLSISSSTENGMVPWYSEPCSSTLAATFSSGTLGERKIVTTDLHQRCTTSHTGTSASAPLAAGIFALALEANPELTWRDMQHLVVQTSRPQFLEANDWKMNGVGRAVSHSFGYGLMNAGDLVTAARNWSTVGPQRICTIVVVNETRNISASGLLLRVHTNACLGSVQHVHTLEHVQARLTLSYSRRGDLAIYLRSPLGTLSMLLGPRPNDIQSGGFDNWPFMTTHSWDENPKGEWTLEIKNTGFAKNRGPLKRFSLVFFGTSYRDPECKLYDTNGTCLECNKNLHAHFDTCVETCPTGFCEVLKDGVRVCTACPCPATNDDHGGCFHRSQKGLANGKQQHALQPGDGEQRYGVLRNKLNPSTRYLSTAALVTLAILGCVIITLLITGMLLLIEWWQPSIRKEYRQVSAITDDCGCCACEDSETENNRGRDLQMEA